MDQGTWQQVSKLADDLVEIWPELGGLRGCSVIKSVESSSPMNEMLCGAMSSIIGDANGMRLLPFVLWWMEEPRDSEPDEFTGDE